MIRFASSGDERQGPNIPGFLAPSVPRRPGATQVVPLRGTHREEALHGREGPLFPLRGTHRELVLLGRERPLFPYLRGRLFNSTTIDSSCPNGSTELNNLPREYAAKRGLVKKIRKPSYDFTGECLRNFFTCPRSCELSPSADSRRRLHFHRPSLTVGLLRKTSDAPPFSSFQGEACA